LCSFLSESIRRIVADVFLMPWHHPLEAERYRICLNLGGCMGDCLDDSLA
jgi:hypothetical protein